MPELGLIDANDIKQLSAEQLTAVCNDLILFNLRLAGLPPTTAELTHAINVRDGGLDALVAWENGPESAEDIPSRNTGFQYKATSMAPQQCADELCAKNGTHLKPAVRQLLDAGGTYVLISGANDVTTGLLDNRLVAMHNVVHKHIGDVAYQLEVWGAQKIANWICTYLPALVYVSNCVGRAHAHELRSFNEWATMHAYKNRYAALPSEQSYRAEIIETLSQNGSVFRLDGLPGLGKTRLALETLRQLDGGAKCTYIDAARQTIADQLHGLIINWKRRAVSGILVVDNCTADLHERIAEEIAGSNISVLTIDYNPTRMSSATPIVHLHRRDPEDIRAIITAEYANTFSNIGLDRIIARADGWPLIALRLAEGLRIHGDIVEDAPEKTLMNRILGISDADRDSRRVIRTLALFEHVGFEAPYQDHLEYIRTTFCEQINPVLFEEIVHGFRQREILAEIGSLLRVTPPPMAVQLAAEWMQTYRQLRERLFDAAMPPLLAEYFAKQFEHLDTVPEAREIAGKLLAAEGMIGNFKALKTRRGARIFLALSKVNPTVANACLMRTILPCACEDLLQYRDGRREVIWALERLIYPSELFLDSAHVLAHLAAAENESISNNATGVLSEKFVMLGAQTEAPGNLRLRFLDELIEMRDEAHLVVAAKCVAASFPPHSAVIRLIDPPEMNRPIREWFPTPDEAQEYRDGLFARAKQLSEFGGEAGRIVRHSIASAVRALIASELFTEMEDLIRSLNRHAEQPWKDAIEQLRTALKYEAKENLEAQARIESLLVEISPPGLIERVQLVVTDPPVDFENCGGNFIDRSAERAADFATEVVHDGQVNEVLSLVVRGTQQKGIQFGNALMIATDYSDDVLTSLITSTADVPAYEQNIGPLAGALSALAEHDRERYSQALTNLLASDILRERIVSVVAIVGPTDADITRLTEALRTQQIAADQFQALSYGAALGACTGETIEHLLDVLLEKMAYPTGYFIASMQCVGQPNRWPIFAAYIKNVILHMDIVAHPLNGIHDWSVIEDARRLLNSPGNEDLAESLAQSVFALAKTQRDFQLRDRLTQFVQPLFGMYLEITWNLLLRELAEADDRERYWLLHALDYLPAGSTKRRTALDDIPIDMLLAACRQYSEILPQHVARAVNLFVEADNGELQPTPIVMSLTEHFAGDDGVRAALESNILSFASVGPRAPYYRLRLQLLNQLPDYANANTRAWLIELRARIEAIANEQEKRDIELQEGAW